ncbi:MAG: glycosyltransferase family 2 protein [Candidatus Aenigmatarchaeota archaeon]
MKDYPLVSIVIPTHNRKEKLIRLINSILESNYPEDKLEIIVVDDASTDGTYEKVKEKFPNVKIFRNNKELFPSAARNRGFQLAKGEYILFIDDDNVVDKDCIKKMVEFLEDHKDFALVAPLTLYYGTNIIWCAGVKRSMISGRTIYLMNGKDMESVNLPKTIEIIDFPNCFLVRSHILRKHNIFFDESLFPFHYEESDFCYRLKDYGYKSVCLTQALVWHDCKRGKVTGFETKRRAYFTMRNRILFHKKYSARWQFLVFIAFFSWVTLLLYMCMIPFDPVKKKKGKS